MDYLYRATFTDGTTFQQPEDDESRLLPGQKSSFYDFLEHSKGRQLTSFSVEGEGHCYTVMYPDEVFLIDGQCAATHGYPLPEGCEWVEGEPNHGVYFRRVSKTFNTGLDELGTSTQFCIGVQYKPGVKNFLGVQ